jgi:hypothetical protein
MNKLWAQVPHTKTRKNVNINMCLVTSNLWIIVDTILCRHQQQFSINVWVRTVGDCLVGLHILPHQLTGNQYRDFLLHDLPKLPEDVPLAEHKCGTRMMVVWHISSILRDVVNNIYHDWEPTALPPWSPDLNPLDFYLWRHLKTLVYAAPVDNE